MRRQIQDQLRRRGFFDAGKLEAFDVEGASLNTSERDYARTQVPVAISDSTSEGNDNLFLVSQENALPTSAGLWAYIV